MLHHLSSLILAPKTPIKTRKNHNFGGNGEEKYGYPIDEDFRTLMRI